MGTAVCLFATIAAVVLVGLVGVADGDRALNGESVGTTLLFIVLLISSDGLVSAVDGINDIKLVGDLIVVSGSVGEGTSVVFGSPSGSRTVGITAEVAVAVGVVGASGTLRCGALEFEGLR